MRFLILGPLEAAGDDGPVALGGNRQRTVLAILVVEHDRRVATDAIIDRLWGERRPRRARNAVQRFVSDLRTALGDHEAQRIVTVDGGYTLRIGHDELDADVFERRVAEGRAQLATSAYAVAATTLASATAMWRSDAVLGELGAADFARGTAVRLEELRLATFEDLVEARLQAGEHHAVIGQVEGLVAEHPFRERLWRQLMLARYRSGRQADALQAFHDARRRLAEELGIEPSPELVALHERILQQDPGLLTTPSAGEPPVAGRSDVRNPYKGLEAFDERDATDFFGREELVADLVGRLQTRRFVALVGPSGGGKSSVLRAGLIPELRRSRGAEVLVALMHPGAHPFEELEAACSAAIGDRSLWLADELAEDETRLRRAIKRLASEPRSELLLIIDQFEELFTLTTDAARRERFVASVLSALDDPGCPVRVVIALRADYYDRPIRYRRFGALVSEEAVTVLPLADHQLERAVTEPAARVGVRFEPRLLAEILADVGDQPAALPLLQYALTELFAQRAGDVIAVDDYDKIGGVLGALTRRADHILGGLDEAGRIAARQLFLRLVALADGRDVTRRRVPRSELLSLAARETMSAVIDAYGAYRFLAFDHDPTTGEPTVEVAHEALLEEWTRLAAWIDDNRQDLQIERRLAAAADEWVDADRDDSFLLTGGRLTQIESWAQTAAVALSEREREFLDASITRRRAEEAAETARRERELALERRAVSRLRGLAAALAVGVVVAVALTVFAFAQRQQADARAREITIQGLTAGALADLDVDPERSVLLAIEAAELARAAGDPVPFAVQEVLHQGLSALRIERSFDGGQIAAFSPDGTRIVTGAADGSAQIWDADELVALHELSGHDEAIHAVAYSPDGTRIATASADNTARIWDAATGFFLTALDHPAAVTDLAWSPDGATLLTGSSSSAFVWDPAAGERVRRVAVATTSDRADVFVAWFPAGDRFVALSGAGGAIFDAADGSIRSRHGAPAVCNVVAAPTGQEFAWSSLDGVVHVVSLDRAVGEPGERNVLGHDGPVCALDIATGDDPRLVSGGSDGTAIVWDAITDSPQATIAGHRAPVRAVAFHPEQALVLTATSDGVVRLADSRLGTSREWAVLDQFVVAAAPTAAADGLVTLSESGVTRWAVRRGSATVADTWETATTAPFGLPYVVDNSPRGDVAFPASDAGTVRVITADGDDHLLTGHDGPVELVRFDAAGERLLTIGSDGQAFTWDVGARRTLAGFTVDAALTKAGVWTPDGAAVVVRSEPSVFRVVDAESGAERRRVTHAEPGSALAISRDGVLAVGGDGGAVSLVDVDTGGLIRSFDTETGVAGLAFSADGARLAGGRTDGSIVLWDVASGARELTLGPMGTSVQRVAFSERGDLLTAIATRGEVAMYVLDPDLLLDIAGERVTRQLTSEECRAYLGTAACRQRG